MSSPLTTQHLFSQMLKNHSDRLTAFALPLLGLTVALTALGILAGCTPVLLMALALFAVSTLLPLLAVPFALGVGLSMLPMVMLPSENGLQTRSCIALGGVVILGTLVRRFLRGIEWRLASQSVLLTLTETNTEDTPDTVIRQALTLLRDFAGADCAIALRQLDDVTAEVLVCLPARGDRTGSPLRDNLTSPTLFAEALEKNRCLYYTDYPATPGAARAMLAVGTQSLAVLPLQPPLEHSLSKGESGGMRGAILLIWYRRIPISSHLQHFIESVLGELRTLLQFQDTTLRLDKLQSRLCAILETIPQGVLFIDESGDSGWINQAAAAQLGLPQGDVEPCFVAQAMAKLRLSADNQEALAAQGAQFFATPSAEIRNWQWVFSQPQRRVLSISSTPTRVRDVPGRLWVLDDITDQYLLQQALVERSQELSKANEELEEAAIKQAQLYQQLAAANQELEKLATKDGMTAIANRRSFDNYLEQVWQQFTGSQSPVTLILVDVDFFKLYNDTYGHQAGDDCLKQIAHALSCAVKRETDLVARYGGEEFVAILPHTDIQGAVQVAELIRLAVAAKQIPHSASQVNQYVTLSLGIASAIPSHNYSPEKLIAAADEALYQAKTAGRDRYAVFDTKMHSQAVTLMQLENELRLAVERQEFRLHYQPIVSLVTGQIIGFEALVRWQHPVQGLVYPSEFIPIAEETGLIKPLSWWVFHAACSQLREWQLRFPQNPPLTMSVNLSRQQLEQSNLLERLDQILQEVGVLACSMKLEITESCLLETKASSSERLLQLKSLGFQLAIDDFGTGYSSLSRLHQFPVDTLKIDRSFVEQIGTGDKGAAIVQAIIMLAHNLDMNVVAEGVETISQLELLQALHCEYGQGYLFSKPLDSEGAFNLLTTNFKIVQPISVKPQQCQQCRVSRSRLV